MAKVEDNIIDDINTDTVYASGNINPDVIPYACYYDEKTIITQNGELLSIIKIPSFILNKSENFYNLRRDLVDSFIKHSKISNNLNFWFQTVRLPVNMIPDKQKYDGFIVADKIIDKWNEHYKWDKQYANEIYISIVIAPEDKKVSAYLNFLKAINFTLLKNSKLREFLKMKKILSSVTNNIVKDLEKYSAETLTIKKIDNTYYSDHLRFFSTIINGDNKNIKLPIDELSHSLITKKIAYGKNIMQIYSKTESQHVAIISLKYCNNLLLSLLDKIIQLNQEMIITQSVTFIDEKPVNDEMMKFFEVLSLNEDPYILNASEIGNMLANNTDIEDKRICLSQVLIKLKAGSKEHLEKNVKSMFSVLNKIGVVAVREEMFMPTLFWSQLPGNFNFIKRFQKIPIYNAGMFTSLFNFPAGKMSGNYWGDAILVLKTALETPYFFSFHNDKNGNTLIIGAKQTKKTKYLNLLLMSAMKQTEKLIYLDNTNRSKIFINSLNGKYYFITRQDSKKRLYINPFKLEKNNENITFILDWLYTIIKNYDDGMIAMDDNKTNLENEWLKLKEIIKNNINSINKIGDVLDIAKKEKMPEISEALNKWASPTGYGFIFNEDKGETLDLFGKERVVGINLNTIINNEELKTAIFKYIIHNILTKADGKPTILAIDESWLLFDNKYFAPNMPDILKQLYDKNIAIVATTSGADSYETSNIQAPVKKVFPTSIFLPNIKTTVYQKKIFGVKEEEARILSIMKEENGNILIKTPNNTIVSSIDFTFLNEEEKTIFSCNNLNCNIMTKAKELINSTDVKDWMPLMFELMKKYNKIKFEEKQKEQERRQIKWEEAKQTKGASNILKANDG